MAWWVYILRSIRYGRYYIGCAEVVKKRLAEHNRGIVRSTKAYRPYEVVHMEVYQTKTEALQRERYLKSPAGWRELRMIKEKGRGFPEGTP